MALNVPELEAIFALRHIEQPFSGMIYVSEYDSVVVAQAFGYANRADELPNTRQTRFGIASGAKIFTAVAIAQLVEDGRLSFETLLADCLPDTFPQFDPTITLHHLLTHSSGIPDYFDEEEMDDFEALWKAQPMYAFRHPHDFLPLFAARPMKFAPGARWSYNNAGYIVLGLVVEQVSGMAFPQYVAEHIFNRCGMTDSGYFAMDRLPARTAYGYIATDDGGWRTNIYAVPIIGGPDGGVFITVDDMARFWDAFLDNRLVSQTITERMVQPHCVAETMGKDIYYGYGVYMERQAEITARYFIMGGDPGVGFYSGIYPQKSIRFTLTANATGVRWPFASVSEAIRNA